MKGSLWIIFVDLTANKIDDKEAEKFETSLEIGCRTSE